MRASFSGVRWVLLVVAGTMFLGGLAPSAQAQRAPDAILQGFYWNVHPGDISTTDGAVWWDSLKTTASTVADAGFETVWTPPPTKGQAGTYSMGYGPSDYYDLGSYNQNGAVRTRFGTKAEFEAAVQEMHNQDLKVMADLVLNHRSGAGATQPEACNSDEQRYTKFRPASGRIPANAEDFHPNSTHCDTKAPYHNRLFFEDICYFNEGDQTPPKNSQWYHGPHNLGTMGDSLIVWGRWMVQDVGVDELRLDAVKHIEPGFLAPFLVELRSGPQPFAMGEYLDMNASTLKSYHDQVEHFVSDYGVGTKDADLALLDFALYDALKSMANDGSGGYNMANLNSAGLHFAEGIPAEDITTFIENHDHDRGGYNPVDCSSPDRDTKYGNTCLDFFYKSDHDPVYQDKDLAYAYMMAAEGRPVVFWKDYWPGWYGLKGQIEGLLALRRWTAGGESTPLNGLNPNGWQVNGSSGSSRGGDFFALRRAGSSNTYGGILAMNDAPSDVIGTYVDVPFQDVVLKDYTDRFLFETTEAFGDNRALVKAKPRSPSWYAPTGLYPRPPGATDPAFTMEAEPGGKVHHVILDADDASNFTVNGAAIAANDQVAILGPSGEDAAGIGRRGHHVTWDGSHDLLIEVLGNGGNVQGDGRLSDGDALQLAVYDASADEIFVASTVQYETSGTSVSVNAQRAAAPNGTVTVTTTDASGTYSAGAVSQITGFTANSVLPVELAGFKASLDGSTARLSWTTASETNNTRFRVQHQPSSPEASVASGNAAAGAWTQVGAVEGAGTTQQPQRYTYQVPDLNAGTHRFRLVQVDRDGTSHPTDPIRVTVGLDQPMTVAPVSPQPVAGQGTVSFRVREPQPVTVALYNLLGRRVATLYQRTAPANERQTVRLPTDGLASGTYFLRVRGTEAQREQRVTVVR